MNVLLQLLEIHVFGFEWLHSTWGLWIICCEYGFSYFFQCSPDTVFRKNMYRYCVTS